MYTYLSTENTRAILPIARILLRITSFRKLAALPVQKLEINRGELVKENIYFSIFQQQQRQKNFFDCQFFVQIEI